MLVVSRTSTFATKFWKVWYFSAHKSSTNMKFKVHIKNTFSESGNLLYGVYQELILGPVFLLINNSKPLKGVWGFPFKLGLPKNPLFQGPPFSLSILHMIPRNSPNGDMKEGHNWLGWTIQTSRKQDASYREDFKG